ncbi:MAG: ribbon-helix-helix domain-containing protein [Thermofilaceae archaeon]
MPRKGHKIEPRSEPRTQIVSFHVPKALLEALDRLVEIGVFNNRSEAIRTALFNLLREHRDVIEKRQLTVGYR